MPELPEVEVLVRHLAPALTGRRIRAVEVHRAKTVRPGSPAAFRRAVEGARFTDVERRGKYLVFRLRASRSRAPMVVLGHLGMTGRMYLQPRRAALPRHVAVAMDLDRLRFVFEDTRYFGRLSLETSALEPLGPEPLGPEFTVGAFLAGLRRSRQAIKVRLLDQRVVAGVGNIYASEALFRARIAPQLPSEQLTREQVVRLRAAIRGTLQDAIRFGSTVPLDWPGRGEGGSDSRGLFYYGRAPGAPDVYAERLAVYDRAGQPCRRCGTRIARMLQMGRSTYYCPHCQPGPTV